jgi:hypothetical protein
MKSTSALFIASISIFFSACQSTNNPFANDKTFAGISPPQIHRVDDPGRDKSKMGFKTEDINEVEAIPFMQYYEALKNIKKLDQNSKDFNKALDDYVSKGIVVVNVSCVRWFNSLSEAEARYNFAQGNQNVIQTLGTALIGLSRLHSDVTTFWGAGFSAVNGYESNFNQNFLISPNANKVKEHVFTALDQQAALLRNQLVPMALLPTTQAALNELNKKENSVNKESGNVPNTLKINAPKTFVEAYLALERYADICTPQTAKEIINASLDGTQTVVNGGQGNKIVSLANNTDADAEKRQAILDSTMVALQKTLTEMQKSSALTNDKFEQFKSDITKMIDKIKAPTSNVISAPASEPTLQDNVNQQMNRKNGNG